MLMDEHHILGVTKLVNWLLGKPAGALLAALRIQAEDPHYPIPNHVSMELLVFAVAAAFAAVIGGLWLWRLAVPWPVLKKRNGLMAVSSGNQASLASLPGHGDARRFAEN